MQKGTEELAQIAFDNTHQPFSENRPFFPIQSGVLVLDPKRSWSLRSAQLNLMYRGSAMKVQAKTEIRDPSAPLPIPLSYTEIREITTHGQTGNRIETWRWDYDFSSPTKLPPTQDFTLSAFGLPEPPGVEWKRPIPWWVWVAGAGTVLLIAGAIFRWLKGRNVQVVS
jgi:hypothetical protein